MLRGSALAKHLRTSTAKGAALLHVTSPIGGQHLPVVRLELRCIGCKVLVECSTDDTTIATQLQCALALSHFTPATAAAADPELIGRYDARDADGIAEFLDDAARNTATNERLFIVDGVPRAAKRAVPWLTSLLEADQDAAHTPILDPPLRPGQVANVAYAARRQRRVLIADEMGTGKSVQALTIVQDCDTVLIVAPASTRVLWADEAERWLHADPRTIHIIWSSDDMLPAGQPPRFVITSYTMATRLVASLRGKFAAVVFDESHSLKPVPWSCQSAKVQACRAIAGGVEVLVMLSGTPSAAKPLDIYHQVDMLRPGLLGRSLEEFALTYCEVQLAPHVTVGKCVRERELSDLLRAAVMTRTRKTDALPDLPRLVRRVARFECGAAASKLRSFARAYQDVGCRKAGAVASHIRLLVEDHGRVVVFAHHIAVLDELHEQLGRTRWCRIVRIDGTVTGTRRDHLVREFQTCKERCVAVLGVTACGAGIDLSTASHCVFAELPPDAMWLRQAEDRLHRAGQGSVVTSTICLALHDEFDAAMWQRLHTSAHSVSGVVQATQRRRARDEARRQGPGASDSGEAVVFLVSAHTGRIHAFNHEGGHATSWHYDEAVSTDAGEFALRFRAAPVSVQRIARAQPMSLHALEWQISNKTPPATSNNVCERYMPRWHINRLPSGCFYFGWRVAGLRSSPEYCAGVTIAAAAGSVLCTACVAVQCVSIPTVAPGVRLDVESDLPFFCSGACRTDFWIRRRSSTIREHVFRGARGVCALCRVDCAALCDALAMAPLDVRLSIVQELHPLLAADEPLAERLAINPTPGNCWHADHILAVCRGGGHAGPDNLQSLCVVCHKNKTARDVA